jgi:hypothetical protein
MRRSLLLRPYLPALVTLLLVAGCGGGSSHSATTGHRLSPSTTQTSSDSRTAPSANGVAFAVCMRANGVSNFPDPQAGGQAVFSVPTGSNPGAPAFRAAESKCHGLLPIEQTPNSGSPPSSKTIAKLVRIAQCMRQHGASGFPDPRTSVPSPIPPGIRVITNFDGAILLFPSTLNIQAPAYRQALAKCGAPPLGLPH